MIKLDLNTLIYPLFVASQDRPREEIQAMPGVYRLSREELVEEAERLYDLGINKILLFGITDNKNESGSSAYAEGNIAARSAEALKERLPSLTVITDVCLCGYTTHGHCGILNPQPDSSPIDNGPTLSALAKMALTHAASGADYVAPSAMAAGQVRMIRETLDAEGYDKTKIMGYSAKFASQFYGPFRSIAGSAPRSGNRSAYQLDPSDARRAFDEIRDDIAEGADMVMVKPALSYLDIIQGAKERFDYPLAAYNVSGEYAMVKWGAENGYWDERKMVYEVIGAIKRAGADMIITYHASDIARWLKEERR
jgi:porphobilinogen synthase